MKYFVGLITSILLCMTVLPTLAQFGNNSIAPSFENHFAQPLTDGQEDAQGNVEQLRNFDISADDSLFDNIRRLFYPAISGEGGQLRDYVTTIGAAIFFIFLVWIGIRFVIDADDESKLSEHKKHLITLLIGAVIFFGAAWILGVALRITMPGGSEAFVDNFQTNLWFQVLSLLKALAFFLAIILLVYTGIKMMQAFDTQEKIDAAKRGIINIIIALIFIKVIDYLFLIAQQPEFFNEARGLIIRISRVMGYIIGTGMVIAIFAAGYNYITDGGTGEGAKRAKNIFLTVFFIGLTIFLFLLITYQIIAQFT